jgi:hypothetical protein
MLTTSHDGILVRIVVNDAAGIQQREGAVKAGRGGGGDGKVIR